MNEAMINPAVWLSTDECTLEAFKRQIENALTAVRPVLADELLSHIPLYQAEAVVQSLSSVERVQAYMAEWCQVFAHGAGIICIRAAYDDRDLLDRVSRMLESIIAAERASTGSHGDHFAPAGANDRLWNAHEKLCIASPELYIQYNANPVLPLVSRAWLGPYYQITTQVNVVHPGGKAQVCHRDYHMGFQNAEVLEQYPAHVHSLSAALTLQGAIAHTDMPIESGPTQLLPGSQTYQAGYLAAQRADFRQYFESNFVQLPLRKGDALFFNPAVFHAAGENRTSDCHRFANLMQIGSGYARSIETLDRERICLAIYPLLQRYSRSGELTAREVADVLAASAEGYPFPINLDVESPLGSMLPQSQLELMNQALDERWDIARLQAELDQQTRNRRSH